MHAGRACLIYGLGMATKIVEASGLTVAVQDYAKAIYVLESRAGVASTNALAERLGVKRATLYSYVSRGLLHPARGPDGSTFEVHVDAQVAGYHRHFVGIIGRNNPRDVQILSFYWTN